MEYRYHWQPEEQLERMMAEVVATSAAAGLAKSSASRSERGSESESESARAEAGARGLAAEMAAARVDTDGKDKFVAPVAVAVAATESALATTKSSSFE